ncbi:MAG: glycosyltransferase [archaeon]|nr:glycosyltransferase [archaeon]
MEKNFPKISICVLTHNSEKTIKECIESIEKIDYPNFELIIVDDNSKDKTIEIAKIKKNSINIKLIEIKEKTKIGKLRNIAVQNSSGEIIAFTDSDCTVQKNWLKELIKGFSDEKTAGAGGPNLTLKENSDFQKCIGNFYEFFSVIGAQYVKNSENIIEVKHNPSCNSAYRKKILEEINGFNENIASNEDPELDFRIRKKGYTLLFNPKAIVFHHRKKNLAEFFRQAEWFGKGRMQAIKQNTEMLELFRLIPIAYLVLLIGSILLLKFGFFVSLIAIFAGFSIIVSALIAFKYELKDFFAYLLLFIAWFFGYGIGEIKGVFS